MQETTPRQRVIALVAYVVALAAVQYFWVEPSFLPSQKALWFYNGIAALLFGSKLLNPHFTPPADAATNGFLVLLAMLAALLGVDEAATEIWVPYSVGTFGAAVLIASLCVLLFRAPFGQEARPLLIAVDQVARRLGSPKVAYNVVMLAAVGLFHRTQPQEVLAILATWTVIVALEPVEGALRIVGLLRGLTVEKWPSRVIGAIAAHQSPGMVLIRQTDARNVKRGTPLIINDNQGPQTLAVALNYVGRDEGNLLRSLAFPVPTEIRNLITANAASVGGGVAVRLDLTDEDRRAIPTTHPASILNRMNQLCGIVDEGTNLDFLQFEVIEDKDLEEGRLVEATIYSKSVLFQIIDGVTHEEQVQQKNMYGYVRARARKVGRWNDATAKFEPVTWLPRINAPVFLREIEEERVAAEAIGYFPRTSYTVGLNISNAVTHNTAILGILGVGKTSLALELVERMIATGIKVVCLDLTDQYANELSEFLDIAYERTLFDQLQHEGKSGSERFEVNQEKGGSVNQFKAKLADQFREFLDPECQRFLRIYNPAAFEVYQQSGYYQYREKVASMATLTATEVAAIISEVLLEVCQEHGMTDSARACIIYEEAHSIVPERNSVAAKTDETATARAARAILQGRKFGLGCLLISQRTANVTKSILNQCNTIFAMRSFDDTSKDFLANYIGRDYAATLPTLKEQQAVVFGKASSCDDPVRIQLNKRQNFLTAFRAENPPRQLPVAEHEPAAQVTVDAGEYGGDLDDEIPF